MDSVQPEHTSELTSGGSLKGQYRALVTSRVAPLATASRLDDVLRERTAANEHGGGRDLLCITDSSLSLNVLPGFIKFPPTPHLHMAFSRVVISLPPNGSESHHH